LTFVLVFVSRVLNLQGSLRLVRPEKKFLRFQWNLVCT